MTKKLLALLAALFLLLGACGDDGGSDDADTGDESEDSEESSSDTADEDEEEEADELALDDWVEQADEICAEFNDESEELDDMFGDLEEGDFEGLAELLDEAIPALEDQVEQFQELGLPDESADEVEEVLDLLEEQVDLAEQFQEAAEDEDEDAFEDIAADADENEQELNDLADELGLEECGEDGDTTDDTTDDTFDTDDTVMEDESEAEGMAGNGVIDAGLLESDIEAEYLLQLGLSIDVTCPFDRPLVSGDVFECEGFDEELDFVTFEVTQLDASGNVVYEVVAINGESL